MASAPGGHAPCRRSDDPGRKALDRNQKLAVPCDNRFRTSGSDRPQYLAAGPPSINQDPCRHRLRRLGVKAVRGVYLPDIAAHESWAEEGQADACSRKLRRNRVGQGAQRELAHGVWRIARSRAVARDAPYDDQVALATRNLGPAGFERAQYAKDVGFELPAVVSYLESIEESHDTETGVGKDYIQPGEGAHSGGDGPLRITVTRHIAGHYDGLHRAGAHHFSGECREQLGAAGGECDLRSRGTELQSEGATDPGRCARDQNRLAAKECAIAHGCGRGLPGYEGFQKISSMDLRLILHGHFRPSVADYPK